MDNEKIDFATFCIGNLARRLGTTNGDIYNRLQASGILSNYIIPAYDTLHTFSKAYQPTTL